MDGRHGDASDRPREPADPGEQWRLESVDERPSGQSYPHRDQSGREKPPRGRAGRRLDRDRDPDGACHESPDEPHGYRPGPRLLDAPAAQRLLHS